MVDTGMNMDYPLVICYIAIENGPFSALIYQWKAMLV